MSTEHDDEPCQTTATAGLLCRNCVTDIDEAMRPKPVPPLPSFTLWGSECTDCGNATPGSMRCDECQNMLFTTPLWIAKTDA